MRRTPQGWTCSWDINNLSEVSSNEIEGNMSAWIIYGLICTLWMDNHLWEHEDIVGAKLIVCVWKCMQARCVKGSDCRAVKLGYTKGLYCVAWWWITITACYCCKVYSDVFYLCTSFCPYHRSFVLWHVVCIFSLKSWATCVRTQAHTRKCFSLHADEFFHPTPFKWSPSQSGLASAFQLTLFPLQMTASTWEMSGSHCQHCGFFKHLWSV